MELKDIVAISGKPGLFKIIRSSKASMVVEAVGNPKLKMALTINHKVSVLKEISIYTTGKEESVPLHTILDTIHASFSTQLPTDLKDNMQLMNFLELALPEYDRDKVYPSDVRKLVLWYKALAENMPVLFEQKSEEATETAAEPAK